MFNSNTSGIPVTMNVEPSGSNNGGGFGNGWGDGWWIILLFILIGFGGYGYGNGGGFGGNGGGYVSDNYALITDNATLERKIDGVYSGICDSTFALNNTITNGFAAAQNTMTQGFAGLNTAIVSGGYETRNAITQDTIANMQNTNMLQGAVKDCCCQTQQNLADVKYTIGSTGADISRGVERGFSDTNYNMATQANMLDRTVSDKFCQTNFNAERNTRDVIDSQTASTQAILARLDAMENTRKDEKIAELTAKLNRADLAASQAAQNTYLLSELKPCPQPAYVVPNPYCNCQCGQNFGTTIA